MEQLPEVVLCTKYHFITQGYYADLNCFKLMLHLVSILKELSTQYVKNYYRTILLWLVLLRTMEQTSLNVFLNARAALRTLMVAKLESKCAEIKDLVII